MTTICRDRLLVDVWHYLVKCRSEGATRLDIAEQCHITLKESSRAIAELRDEKRIIRRGTHGRYVVVNARRPHIAHREVEVPS